MSVQRVPIADTRTTRNRSGTRDCQDRRWNDRPGRRRVARPDIVEPGLVSEYVRRSVAARKSQGFSSGVEELGTLKYLGRLMATASHVPAPRSVA